MVVSNRSSSVGVEYVTSGDGELGETGVNVTGVNIILDNVSITTIGGGAASHERVSGSVSSGDKTVVLGQVGLSNGDIKVARGNEARVILKDKEIVLIAGASEAITNGAIYRDGSGNVVAQGGGIVLIVVERGKMSLDAAEGSVVGFVSGLHECDLVEGDGLEKVKVWTVRGWLC